MPLFKCRDCGYDVDDPTTHICGPPPSAPTPTSRYNPGGGGGGRGYDDPYSPAATRSPYGGYGSDSYSNPGKGAGAGAGRPASPPRSPYDDRYRYGNGSSGVGGGGGYGDRSPYDDYGSSGARGADNGRAPPSPAPDSGKSTAQSEADKKSAAAGFGLDFFSSSYNKLFGGAGGDKAGGDPNGNNNNKKASDADVDNVTRKLDATSLGGGQREQVATMYSNTSSMPPQTPSANDVIELSEIMLFKDTKGVTCTGCRAPVWKGEEIVCIDMDVVHATCCVCQECGLTADRDPYGSDGWKQIGGIVVCADCLARDPTIGQSAGGSAPPPMGGSNKVQPEPSPYGNSKSAMSAAAPPAPPTPDYEVCGTCRLSIMNASEIVTHPKLKGSHHARCLTCQHCNRGIDESFGPSNPVHVRQSRPLCHPCYLVTLPRCGGCKNVITRDTRVCAALGRKYHPQCFVCAKCSTSFPDKSFYVLKDQPYCRQCYHEENGTICGGCQQPIEGPCACVVEGRFHPNCFACATCRDPLTDVYYSYEGRPYCEVHILELQRRRGGKAERRQTYYRNM